WTRVPAHGAGGGPGHPERGGGPHGFNRPVHRPAPPLRSAPGRPAPGPPDPLPPPIAASDLSLYTLDVHAPGAKSTGGTPFPPGAPGLLPRGRGCPGPPPPTRGRSHP